MPTVTDHPNSIGSWDQWLNSTGAGKVSDVSTDDGDTSYIYGHNGQRQYFGFPNLPAAALENLISCTISVRTRDDAAGGPSMYIYNGSAEVLAAIGQGTSYQTFSTAHYSLLKSQVNGSQAGLYDLAGGGVNTLCTEIKRVTVYRVAVGTYAGNVAITSGVAGAWNRTKAYPGENSGNTADATAGVAANYSFVPAAGSATYTYNGNVDMVSGVDGDVAVEYTPQITGVAITPGLTAAYVMQRTIYEFSGNVAIVSGLSAGVEYVNNFVHLEDGRYVWGFSDRYLEDVAAAEARLGAVDVDGSLVAALERGDTFQWVQHKPE